MLVPPLYFCHFIFETQILNYYDQKCGHCKSHAMWKSSWTQLRFLDQAISKLQSRLLSLDLDTKTLLKPTQLKLLDSNPPQKPAFLRLSKSPGMTRFRFCFVSCGCQLFWFFGCRCKQVLLRQFLSSSQQLALQCWCPF